MNRPLPRHSMLDSGDIPIIELARIAMREGVRPRAAYQAHKWFARRFAVTARSLLVAAASDRSQSFWRQYYKSNLWTGRSVLDPFVGGGVMLLEALRLGADVHGVDIEPVAAAIAKMQTELRTLPDVEATLEMLIKKAEKNVATYYLAQDESGREEILLHAFWVQVVKCRCCKTTFDAHPKYRLASDESRECQWIACKSCSRVRKSRLNAKSSTCDCGVRTETDGGRLIDGAAYCPECRQSEPLIELARRTKAKPRFRIFAVETLPSESERRVPVSDRRIRTASSFDQQRYALAAARLRRLLKRDPGILPKGRIPRRNRADRRLIDYGYSDYRELFNDRQLLHFAMLGKEIAALPESVRQAFQVAFSDHLTTNNMMCAYAGAWRRLTPLFSIRAYRHIARPVEINPWLRHNGRGTYPNAVRSVVAASNALKNPIEPGPRGTLWEITDAEPGQRDIVCGDARHLTRIPTQSIDLVLTDPPYFDYISYSELGHFFTPWFRRFGFIGKHVGLSFPPGQLASTNRSQDGEKQFARQLARAFKHMRRVCRDQGRIAFTYQNLDGKGWSAVASALALAGIEPIRTFPFYGESGVRLHKHDGSISWDCVMVCRPSEPRKNHGISADASIEGQRDARAWRQKLRRAGLPFSEGDLANLSYASSIVRSWTLTGDIAANPRSQTK